MTNLEYKRAAKNGLNGLAMGLGLFLAGLFTTIWSWGLAGGLGVPMMLGGLALPFWSMYQARRGRNWVGVRSGQTAVKSRREIGEERARVMHRKAQGREVYAH